MSAGISALAIPFLALSRRQHAAADFPESLDRQAEAVPQPA
jgi:hypothetical protein